jgi:hypothetical protein
MCEKDISSCIFVRSLFARHNLLRGNGARSKKVVQEAVNFVSLGDTNRQCLAWAQTEAGYNKTMHAKKNGCDYRNFFFERLGVWYVLQMQE